jgi:hypothetical protein
MNTKVPLKSSLIAACGMNCGICRGYLREKKKCPGCRGSNENKSISCVNCKIKVCNESNKNNLKFCFECDTFPCKWIKHMDKRYRTRYNMSTIENLENIKKFGVREFVKNEKIRWACPQCGGTICVHTGYCSRCENQSI